MVDDGMEVMTKELIIKEKQLPAKLSDLVRFVLIGREKLTAVRAEIRAIDKLDLATGVREQKIGEAQMLGGALLDAEVKLGELTSEIPLGSGGDRRSKDFKNRPATAFEKTKEQTIKELGFTNDQVEKFESLADHKDLVEEVKKEAKENEDIPTRSEVLRKIKEKGKATRRKEEAEAGKSIILPNQIDLRLGDFRKVLNDIEPVDLILTDPPYPEEFLPLWNDLGKFAKEKLKDGGYLIAYSGQLHLPEVMNLLSKHLDYVWTFCLYHEGLTQIVNGVNVICRWKPILIYQKGKKKFKETIQDYVVSEKREKGQHDWQQGLSAVKELVQYFSETKDIICDPFSGSGTVAEACKILNRKFAGAEIDNETYNISKKRLQ